MLIECDPSIKSIIVKIDSENNDFIVEELDDQTLVIKEGKLETLKKRLDEVSLLLLPLFLPPLSDPYSFYLSIKLFYAKEVLPRVPII